MKSLTIGLLLLLISCTSENIPKEKKVQAFCVVEPAESLKLEDNSYLNLEKIKVVFTRIDNQIYETTLSNGHFNYFKLNYDSLRLGILLKGFSKNSREKLDLQIISKRQLRPPCGGFINGYFLDDAEQPNFCLLSVRELTEMMIGIGKIKREKVKDKATTELLEHIYFKMNSMRWDYYMSNRYHYNEYRVESFSRWE